MITLLARPHVRRVLNLFTWQAFARSLPWLVLCLGITSLAWRYAQPGTVNSLLLLLVAWLLARVQAQALKVTDAMRLSTLVYKNSNQGMVVTDANGTIVSVNPAFTAITGYAERDVIGKNPRMWRSGRHNQEFYRNLWQSLHEKKQWQGEIWNRRKNGEVFAEYLVLNAIINNEGQLEGYVSLYSDLTEKKRSDDLIWRQINFDSLTGYPNRNLLQERLAMEINRCQADATSFAFLLIDLDNFKNINDTLGHHVGDLLLVELAHRLAACIGEADTLARFGGDEFAIIYHPDGEQKNATLLAQQIIQGLTASFSVDGETVYTSVSIGMTFYPQEAGNVADILKNADQALFRAKNSGRNRFAYFTPEMQLLAQERQSLEKDLRHALDNQQLIVYFQPIVDLATGNIFKAEALLRWRHPERGMISPAAFIPLAEESGLINPIGDWVFYEAAKWSRRWSQLLGRTFQISVNKSPVQFYATADARSWIDHLRGHGMPGSSIAIEITEGVLLNADGKVGEQLTQYVAAGMEVSIDDFGTGYSSLAYLKKFHIDYLKVDQSFVRDMTTNPVDRTIVEATIMMAHRLEFKVIAEGIENPWQLKILSELGCEYGQGYLFSRPIPAQDFERLLAERTNLIELMA
jgi:diguanylate cyclase (GGDEF)-like protein/PAS domain S-box-containing protein